MRRGPPPPAPPDPPRLDPLTAPWRQHHRPPRRCRPRALPSISSARSPNRTMRLGRCRRFVVPRSAVRRESRGAPNREFAPVTRPVRSATRRPAGATTQAHSPPPPAPPARSLLCQRFGRLGEPPQGRARPRGGHRPALPHLEGGHGADGCSGCGGLIVVHVHFHERHAAAAAATAWGCRRAQSLCQLCKVGRDRTAGPAPPVRAAGGRELGGGAGRVSVATAAA
jgi:hypothetical protein